MKLIIENKKSFYWCHAAIFDCGTKKNEVNIWSETDANKLHQQMSLVWEIWFQDIYTNHFSHQFEWFFDSYASNVWWMNKSYQMIDVISFISNELNRENWLYPFFAVPITLDPYGSTMSFVVWTYTRANPVCATINRTG